MEIIKSEHPLGISKFGCIWHLTNIQPPNQDRQNSET